MKKIHTYTIYQHHETQSIINTNNYQWFRMAYIDSIFRIFWVDGIYRQHFQDILGTVFTEHVPSLEGALILEQTNKKEISPCQSVIPLLTIKIHLKEKQNTAPTHEKNCRTAGQDKILQHHWREIQQQKNQICGKATLPTNKHTEILGNLLSAKYPQLHMRMHNLLTLRKATS